MFTVKATYRNETRKFSFADPAVFPSFEQLYHQLYRVFPISHSYYLSKLLFSPNSDHQRILIGMEAHSADEYDAHIAPYQGREWPGALLKFSVFDETPHKSPNASSSNLLIPTVSSDVGGVIPSGSTSQTPVTFVETMDRLMSTRKERDDRKYLLDRIRERTTTRHGVTFPLSPSAASKDSETSRPLPHRPLSRVSSTPTASSTSRPSLFDLLSSDDTMPMSDSGSTPKAGPVGFERPSTHTRPARLMERLNTSSQPPSSLYQDPALAPWSSLVVPPPPILYPSVGVSKPQEGWKSAPDAGADVVMSSPVVSSADPVTQSEAAQPTASYHQSTKPAEQIPQHTLQSSARRTSHHSSTTHCCSVAQGKMEVKDMMTSFISDLDSTMKTAFGDEWASSIPPRSSAHSAPIVNGCEGECSRRTRSQYRSLLGQLDDAMPGISLQDERPRRSRYRDFTSTPSEPILNTLSEEERLKRRRQYRSLIGNREDLWSPIWQDVEERAAWRRQQRPPFSPPPSTPAAPQQQNEEEWRQKRREYRDIVRNSEAANLANYPFSVSPREFGPGGLFDHADDVAMPGSFVSRPSVFATSSWDSPSPTVSPPPPSVKPQRTSQAIKHVGITCDACHKIGFTGVRFKCLKCEDFDLCSSCMSSPDQRGCHSVDHAFFPIDTPTNYGPYSRARAERHPLKVVHPSIVCDACDGNISGVRHKCLDCQDYDMCTSCISTPSQREKHSLSHVFFPIEMPGRMEKFNRVREQRRAAAAPHVITPPTSSATALLVHKNVICDNCEREIVGVRHKCLDCPDFDLCTECHDAPDIRAQHSPRHEFFSIDRPGEVIVHTVFGGDGERTPAAWTQPRPEGSPSRTSSARLSTAPPAEPIVHNAVCNLCDSRVRGERYKCLNCPDFDTCSSCFKITEEQHPGHGFVKISKPEELVIRNALHTGVTHLATCNVCNTRIVGMRYKCMHEDCEDFDLCQACEALPIPVHPLTHPLLKMRTPTTVVPAMRRSTQRAPSKDVEPAQAKVAQDSSSTLSTSEHHLDSIFMSVAEQRAAAHQQVQAPSPTEAGEPTPSSTEHRLDAQFLAMVEQMHVDQPRIPATPPELEPSSAETVPSSAEQQLDSCFLSIAQTTLGNRHEDDQLHALLDEQIQGTDMPPLIPLSPVSEPDTFITHVPPTFIVDDAVGIGNHFIPSLETAPTPDAHATVVVDRLVDVDDSNDKRSQVGTESSLGGLTTPSEAPASTTSSNPVPRLEPVNNEWRDLWPELTTVLKHLLQPPTPTRTSAPPLVSEPSMPGAMRIEEPTDEAKTGSTADTEVNAAVEESPTHQRRLSDYLGETRTETEERIGFAYAAPVDLHTPLFATFMSDNNIPDGQMFPPGAEFVKSWRMMNPGRSSWPETTELVFVAGDRLASHANAPQKVKVGVVKAGEQVEVVAGEMKAPEIPGKYVSYWRLSDGLGNLFGHSVWVDIVVVEVNRAASELSSAEESLAASSVIMPQSTPEPSAEQRSSTTRTLSVTIPSAPPSESGSFDSSTSLIDTPSSPFSDEDEAIYEDSRSHVLVSPEHRVQETEFVMLYESSSEDD